MQQAKKHLDNLNAQNANTRKEEDSLVTSLLRLQADERRARDLDNPQRVAEIAPRLRGLSGKSQHAMLFLSSLDTLNGNTSDPTADDPRLPKVAKEIMITFIEASPKIQIVSFISRH